jgi:hypothetical protein
MAGARSSSSRLPPGFFSVSNAPVPISVPVRVAGRQEPGRRAGGTPVPSGPSESVIPSRRATRPFLLRIGRERTSALTPLSPAFLPGVADRAVDDVAEPGTARHLVVVEPDRTIALVTEFGWESLDHEMRTRVRGGEGLLDARCVASEGSLGRDRIVTAVGADSSLQPSNVACRLQGRRVVCQGLRSWIQPAARIHI